MEISPQLVFLIFALALGYVNGEALVKNSTHLHFGDPLVANYFNGIPKSIKPTIKVVNLTKIRTTPELLLQALDGCNSLETLELNSIEIASAENPEFNLNVYLPNLKSFKFSYSTKNSLKNWNPNFESLAFFRKTNSTEEAENVFNGNVDILIQQGWASLKINRDVNEITMEQLHGEFVDQVLCGLESNFKTKSLKLSKLGSPAKLDCVNWSKLEKISLNLDDLVDSKFVLDKLVAEAKSLKEFSLHLETVIIDQSLTNSLKKLPLTNVICRNTAVDLDWIPKSLKNFESIECTLYNGNLNDLLQKASSLEYLHLDNSKGLNLELNLTNLPKTIRTLQLRDVNLIYDKSSTNDLTQFESLIMLGGNLLNLDSKFPASLKTLILNEVRVHSEIIENGLSGTNLERLDLLKVLEEIDDIERNGKITRKLTIDIFKLNLSKIKSLPINEAVLIESSPNTITEFKQLEELTLKGNMLIQGSVSSLNAASIKRLYIVDGLKFVNTTFKDVFGSNEHIESIFVASQPWEYPPFDLAQFPTKGLKQITSFLSAIEIGNSASGVDIKFDSLEKLVVTLFSSARGPDFVQSMCSMVANAKNFNELKLETLKEKQSLDLSACFPIQNLNTLFAVGLSSLNITEDAVFPKLTKLELHDDLEELNKGLIDNITSVFPGANYMKLWTSNNANAYNFVHKLITDSCVQEFETKLGRVNPSEGEESNEKFNQVEKFLDEYGVNKEETLVRIFRSNLPAKCNP